MLEFIQGVTHKQTNKPKKKKHLVTSYLLCETGLNPYIHVLMRNDMKL